MIYHEDPLRKRDLWIFLVSIGAFIVSIISTTAPDFVISLSRFLSNPISREKVKVVGALAGFASFCLLMYEVFFILNRMKSRLEAAANEFSNQYNVIHDVITSTGSQSEQLSVVAPAGKWLQTSSWDEIVKKMREMLRTHGWGQVPAYSSIKYLITFDHYSSEKFQPEHLKLKGKTSFVKVNFFQTSGFNWQNFRNDDQQNGTEPLNRRAALFDALNNALATYIVMPYNHYSSHADLSSHLSAVYPLSEPAINEFEKLYEQDLVNTLASLRQIQWKGPCSEAIFDEVTKVGKHPPREFPGLFPKLSDADLSIQLGVQDDGKPEILKYAFSVNIVFQNDREKHVEKIRYLSVFDASGEIDERCLAHMPETDGNLDWEGILNDSENRIIGCYVPYSKDVDQLKKKCNTHPAEDWSNVRIVFSWSYLHLRALKKNDGEWYVNNSWSFQIYSVGQLERAEFRDDGRMIKFENETAVTPYTMTPLALLPEPERDVGYNKVVFEGAAAFATSPSDVFHVSWGDPEVNRLEEENKKLNEENDTLKQENDRLKEEKPQPGGAQSSNPPAEVENLTISNRAS